MPDTKVQMNVTLTDGTVINAGQFTVPEGPVGPAGQDGAAGADGVTPLIQTKVFADLRSSPPVMNDVLNIENNFFNRTPTVNDSIVAYVYNPMLKRTFLTSGIITNVTSNTSSYRIDSVNEIGVGIKSVAVTEVAQ